LVTEEGADELEKKAMELLRQSKDGVLQSDLWKSLKMYVFVALSTHAR